MSKLFGLCMNPEEHKPMKNLVTLLLIGRHSDIKKKKLWLLVFMSFSLSGLVERAAIP